MRYIQRLSMDCCNCCNKQQDSDEDSADLGTGKRWAKSNLTSSGIGDDETIYGDFFAWGEITTKDLSQYATTSAINGQNWQYYKLYDTDENKIYKYTDADGKTELELDNDAAYQIIGRQTINGHSGYWRIPSKSDFEDLLNPELTVISYETDYKEQGVQGLLFTNKNDSTQTMFLPATGNTLYTENHDRCCYLTSTLGNQEETAFHLHQSVSDSEYSWIQSGRNIGFIIRPIWYPDNI